MNRRQLSALCTALATASCYGGPAPEDFGQTGQQAVFGPTDDRQIVTSIAYPYSAMGLVTSGGRCTGTLIAPDKVLTAQHCLGASLAQTTFWRHGAPSPTAVTRIVAGRGANEGSNPHDWAILWLATPVPASATAVMNVTDPASSAFTVRRAGYSWDLDQLEEVTSCSVTSTTAQGVMLNNCDLLGGASGGPYFLYNGTGTASLVGVTSGHATGPMCAYNAYGASDAVNCGSVVTSSNPANAWTYSEAYANSAVSAALFRTAPHYTGSVSVVSVKSGLSSLMRVQALDPERGTLHERAKASSAAGSAWNAWSFGSTSVRGGLSAGTLQDGRQFMLGLGSTGGLLMAWASSVGGTVGAWSSFPGPGAPYLFTAMRDTAIGRTSDGRTQIYALAQSGAVYTAWKTSDSNSTWSAWVNMGTPMSGATSIAAYTMSDGTQQLWVAGSSGVRTAWLTPGVAAWTAWSTFVLATPGLPESWTDIAVSATQSNRVDVWGVSVNGVVFRRTKATSASSSAWTAPWLFKFDGSAMTGMRAISAARLSDGREVLVTANTSGEVFLTWEVAEDSFSTWSRFYR